MLGQAGIIGLVEPLGFEICSLRSKNEAAEAIGAVGGEAGSNSCTTRSTTIWREKTYSILR